MTRTCATLVTETVKIFVLLILLLPLPTTSLARSSSKASLPPGVAVETSICDVVSHPKKFNGLRVRVFAEVLADMHGRVVSDPNCPLGMELGYELTPGSGSDIVALDNAIYREGCIGTTWKHIHATMSGTYLWRPQKKMGKHLLELDLVENLQVTREPGDCYDRPAHSRAH